MLAEIIRRKWRQVLKDPLLYIKQVPVIIRQLHHFGRMEKEYIMLGKKIIGHESELLAISEDYRPYIEYIKRNRGKPEVFNADFANIDEKDVSPMYDDASGLWYVMHNGHRLYYKQDRPDEVAGAYCLMSMEQHPLSPHRYIREGDSFKDMIVFDCGAAEGNFTLDVIDEVKSAYLFEGDESWGPALAATFGCYEQKVHVIPKFVGGKTEGNYVSLREIIDDLIHEGVVKPGRDTLFIKMDIEGSEEETIRDMERLFRSELNIIFDVCVYHKKNSETEIRSILGDGFKIVANPGYMLFICEGSAMEFPYFRRGVLRAEKLP